MLHLKIWRRLLIELTGRQYRMCSCIHGIVGRLLIAVKAIYKTTNFNFEVNGTVDVIALLN